MIELFGVVLGLGGALLFFHGLSDERIRAVFAKIIPCLRRK